MNADLIQQAQVQQAFWQQQAQLVETVQTVLANPDCSPATLVELQHALTHQQQVQTQHAHFMQAFAELPREALIRAPEGLHALRDTPSMPEPTHPFAAPFPAESAPPATPIPVARSVPSGPPGLSTPEVIKAETPGRPQFTPLSKNEADRPESAVPPLAANSTLAGEAKESFEAPAIEERRIRRRHRFEFWLFQKLKHWAEHASEASRSRMARMFEGAMWLGKVRQDVVEANLRIAFPDWTESERTRLARQNLRWFLQFSMDVLRMGAWQEHTAQEVRFENREVLDEALAEQRGVLMVGGHFGNWEYLCPALSQHGYSTSMYVGRQTNPLVDRLQNEQRLRSRIQTIGKGRQATAEILQALKANRAVGMLVDQDERKSGVFVDFFGVPASSSRGAAAFHLLQKSPVVFFSCAYESGGVSIEFERIAFRISGHQERDVRELTSRIQQALEQRIRSHPEQYFWMHRRWRTRPEGAPELYE